MNYPEDIKTTEYVVWASLWEAPREVWRVTDSLEEAEDYRGRVVDLYTGKAQVTSGILKVDTIVRTKEVG